jgi:hypothetical protein
VANFNGPHYSPTVIRGGAGVSLVGSGTPTNPYFIGVDTGDLSGFLSVRDTASINMTLIGSGATADPFVLQADVILKVTDLIDVQDPEGGPASGDVLLWQEDHFELAPPPPNPAGSVNTGPGLAGTGAADNLLRVAVSGVWGQGSLANQGSDSTIGQPIYVDSAGVVRTAPVVIPSLTWDAITGKPTTFAPSAHTHDDRYYTESEMNTLLNGKANTNHSHTDLYYSKSEVDAKTWDRLRITHPDYNGGGSGGFVNGYLPATYYSKGEIDSKVTTINGNVSTAQTTANTGVTNAAAAQSTANSAYNLANRVKVSSTDPGGSNGDIWLKPI